jgi:hypothetical protein
VKKPIWELVADPGILAHVWWSAFEPNRRPAGARLAMSAFKVRRLNLSVPLPDASHAGELDVPELEGIKTALGNAFTGGKCGLPVPKASTHRSTDRLTAVVTGQDPSEKDSDTRHIGPFCITTVVAGLIGGEVYVAETDNDEKKIIGCAVWFGPGYSIYDTCVMISACRLRHV